MAKTIATKPETKPAPTPVQDAIYKAYEGAARQVVGFAIATGEQKAAAEKLANEQGNKRAALLCNLADLACKHQWSDAHITAAIDAYMAKQNDKNISSLRQFAGEAKRACHMNARAFVKQDYERATTLWTQEREAVAKAKKAHDESEDENKGRFVPPPQPLKEGFSKAYHVVFQSNGMCAARAEGNTTLAEAPADLARRNIANRAADPKLAAKAIKGLIGQIEAIAAEFPHENWPIVIEFLGTLSADELARNRKAQQVANSLKTLTASRTTAPAPTQTKREKRAARKNGTVTVPANVGEAIDSVVDSIA